MINKVTGYSFSQQQKTSKFNNKLSFRACHHFRFIVSKSIEAFNLNSRQELRKLREVTGYITNNAVSFVHEGFWCIKDKKGGLAAVSRVTTADSSPAILFYTTEGTSQKGLCFIRRQKDPPQIKTAFDELSTTLDGIKTQAAVEPAKTTKPTPKAGLLSRIASFVEEF
ncbi:MAG: hypothetical protein PHC64_01195 [Candidatus Gastranaerophilales bacterium]|nr:hypothetical protein [Candidatus Gastranaerophilales bacterium]